MSAAAQLTHAWKLHQEGDLAGAANLYLAVLAAEPSNASAWCYWGILRHDQKQYKESEAAYRRAIALQPDFPVAFNNLGNTLCAQERREEALDCFDRAIVLQPTYANAYKNKGASLHWLGRADEAESCFLKGLELAPADAQIHRDLGVLRLLQGRYDEAWPEYEWRWKTPSMRLPPLRRPQWDGGSLDGKTIFLLGEQGMGDIVHFIRYAGRLKQLYRCRVLASCHKPLLPLMKTVPGLDGAMPLGGEPHEYDVFCPLLSVAAVLGGRPDSFPADIPYLQAEEGRISRWRNDLAGFGGRRIGIVWQGSPGFEGDRMRSAPLAAFAPLGRLPGVTLVSLQKGYGEEKLEELGGRFHVLPLGRRLDNDGLPFLDTAAVLKSLDLLITVDTAIGHIAGALGVPVWLALAYVPDWRWGIRGDRTVWYPTMRFFRQTRRGEWTHVFESMARTLAEEIRPAAVIASRQINPVANSINVAISPGELLDKITILEIKSARIADAVKLNNVRVELEILEGARRESVPSTPEMAELTAQLKAANEALWEIEDAIRDCERDRDFGEKFIELARSVYHTNDRRAALKRQVNDLLGSQIVEEKSYAKY